jgi:Doublecortin
MTTAPPGLQNAEPSTDRVAIADKFRLEPISSERAQTITLYANGDTTFFGKKLLVNRRRIRTWESFLRAAAEATGELHAVREIATPENGTRINSLDQLQDQASYVTIAKGNFKPIG